MTKGMLARRALAVVAAAASLALIPAALPASAHSTAVPRAFVAVLTGANSVPPVDTNGIGLGAAIVNPTSGMLCYVLTQRNLEGTVTLAHIHRGVAGTNGPVVVPLQAPVDGVSHDCLTIDTGLATEIVNNPQGFYFNIHTTVFPAGAIRAQLR